MNKTNRTVNYVILAKSEILGSFAPTAHGTFSNRGDAEQFAKENIRHTEYKVEVAG